MIHKVIESDCSNVLDFESELKRHDILGNIFDQPIVVLGSICFNISRVDCIEDRSCNNGIFPISFALQWIIKISGGDSYLDKSLIFGIRSKHFMPPFPCQKNSVISSS